MILLLYVVHFCFFFSNNSNNYAEVREVSFYAGQPYCGSWDAGEHFGVKDWGLSDKLLISMEVGLQGIPLFECQDTSYLR